MFPVSASASSRSSLASDRLYLTNKFRPWVNNENRKRWRSVPDLHWISQRDLARKNSQLVVARRPLALTPVVLASVGVILVAVLFFANPYEKAIQNQILGLALMAFGGTPIVRWSMRPQSDPLPVLQVVGLFYAICYGFGGLITPDRFMGGIVVSEDQYTPGLIGAIGSLAMIYMAFSLGKRIPWPKTPSIYRIDDVRTDELALYIALPASIIVDQVATRIDGSVQSITSPIRAFFFVWSLYSALSGRYSRVGRIITYFVFTPLYLILYLINQKSYILMSYFLLSPCTFSQFSPRQAHCMYHLKMLNVFMHKQLSGVYTSYQEQILF